MTHDEHIEQDKQWLAGHVGFMLQEPDGQCWMLVGFEGRWAVFENEDERIWRMHASTARSLLVEALAQAQEEPR